MTFTNVIQVFEFEKLYYDDNKPFKKKHWDALCHYQECQNKKGGNVEYFRILNRGVQFVNYVGVIQAGNLTVEILPKIDNAALTASNQTIAELQQTDIAEAAEKNKWHGVLLDMLKECRLLKVNNLDNANLKLRSNSILDIYIELFLAEAEKLIHEGLLKKYKKEHGNKTFLKGQLQFSKQIAYNSVHQERFYVRHTEYNQDNTFNRILHKTLQLIPKINNNGFLLDWVGRLLLDFPEVSNCATTEETFDRLVYDRKAERYKQAIFISKLLLLNYRPGITGGADNVIAILFDMNKLWEEFIYRRLKKEEKTFGMTVLRQGSKNFWLKDGNTRSKTIRPDIVVKYRNGAEPGKEKTLVVDTKWKNNDQLEPSDEDLKQMFVYNLFWNCDKSVLLYPSNNPKKVNGKYHSHDPVNVVETACQILTVSIINKQKLDKDLGIEILQHLVRGA
jgi:5-methylcytosine-specific restriction enzyme subunit McrC